MFLKISGLITFLYMIISDIIYSSVIYNKLYLYKYLFLCILKYIYLINLLYNLINYRRFKMMGIKWFLLYFNLLIVPFVAIFIDPFVIYLFEPELTDESLLYPPDLVADCIKTNESEGFLNEKINEERVNRKVKGLVAFILLIYIFCCVPSR